MFSLTLVICGTFLALLGNTSFVCMKYSVFKWTINCGANKSLGLSFQSYHYQYHYLVTDPGGPV